MHVAAFLCAAAIVKHVVMFDFKRNVSDDDLIRIKLALLDLPSAIPSIQSYELGQDLMLESGQKHPLGKNRRLSWTATFKNVDAYESYLGHAAHVAFLQNLKPLLLRNSRAAIQYRIKSKAKAVPIASGPSMATKRFREAFKLFVFGMLIVAILEWGLLDRIAARDWW